MYIVKQKCQNKSATEVNLCKKAIISNGSTWSIWHTDKSVVCYATLACTVRIAMNGYKTEFTNCTDFCATKQCNKSRCPAPNPLQLYMYQPTLQ